MLAAVPGVLAGTAAAAQTRLRIDAEANALASDNPFLLPDGNTQALAAEVIARSDVRWPLGPGTTVDTDLELGLRQYSRRYGHFVLGRGGATLDHRDSEYLSINSTVSYARELPSEALASSIDSAIDPVSVVSTFLSRSVLTWNLDARTSILTGFGLQRIDRDSSILPRATTRDLSLGFARQVSPLLRVGLDALVTVGKGGAGDESRSRAVRLTASRRLDKFWRADLRLGVERLDVVSGLGGRNNRTQFTGGGSFCYEPTRLSACLTGDVRSGISAIGGLQRELAVGAIVNRQVSEHGTLRGSAEYRRSTLGILDRSVDALRLTSRYEHRLTERLSLTAGADYLRRTGITERSIAGAAFRIGLTLRDVLR